MNSQRDKKFALRTKAIASLAALITFSSSLPAYSAIPFRNSIEQMDLINNKTKELNLPLFAKMQAIVDQTRFNMADYIPLSNLPMSDNGEVIARRIMSQTMKTVFEMTNARESSLVKSAEAVNQSLSTTVKNEKHSFSFRVRALETEAEITYKGAVNATLSYDVSAGQAKFEVSQEVGTKTYTLSHVSIAGEHKDLLGMRWNF